MSPPSMPSVMVKEWAHSLELVKVLFIRIVVEIGALVWATNHGADQIGVFPDLLIAHGRLQARLVVVQPLLEVQWLAVVVIRHGMR